MLIFPEYSIILLAAAAGILLGVVMARLRYGAETKTLRSSLDHADHELKTLREEFLALSRSHAVFQERANTQEEISCRFADIFESLSARALKENNRAFLDLAENAFAKHLDTARTDLGYREKAVRQLVEPLQKALDKYDRQMTSVEKSREQAYGGLRAQIEALLTSQKDLTAETGNLAKALRVPHVRGRWGEVTLRRAAELSGMQDRCDFTEQHLAGESALRPDMVIHLPGERQIVVDAKMPLSAYLESLEAGTESEREAHLRAHAKQVQSHIKTLSQKAYWSQFQTLPEFVVLFIPGENFFSAALSQMPDLIEEGVRKGVILATPTTLISLLKAVSYGWRQETATQQARNIHTLGRELYLRLARMADYMNRLGKDLGRVTSTYNQVVGAFERRVFSSARKFNAMGVVSAEQQSALHVETVNALPRNANRIAEEATEVDVGPAEDRSTVHQPHSKAN